MLARRISLFGVRQRHRICRVPRQGLGRPFWQLALGQRRLGLDPSFSDSPSGLVRIPADSRPSGHCPLDQALRCSPCLGLDSMLVIPV